MERHIESKIYELSNNSQITRQIISTLKEKFDEKDLRNFYKWLQIIDSKKIESNKSRNSFKRFF